MLDLLSHGVPTGVRNGREFLEIPSLSFVAKCSETKAERQAAGDRNPLPPD